MAASAAVNRRRLFLPITFQWKSYLFVSDWNCGIRCFSGSSTDSARSEFDGENAYELLGVSESSSFDEIKSSFRKLAKETHPDLAESRNDSTTVKRFVQILAAYEILSNSEKRAHYDRYLFSQRKTMQKPHRRDSTLYTYNYNSHMTSIHQMEVVEWLEWYRITIKDILSEKKVVVGTGYFDVLEGDFYSAIHAAYYGPVIESLDLLPDRFEAEERSVYETPEVLHLVSGRDVFGMVCLVNKIPELSVSRHERLTSCSSGGSDIFPTIENESISIMNSDKVDEFGVSRSGVLNITNHTSDAYKDLELHVCGRIVAVSTRIPPNRCCDGIHIEDTEDQIHVFLSSHEEHSHVNQGSCKDSLSGKAEGSRVWLGSISGLGTSPEEGSCDVYNSSGNKTHVLMKHRTLMVKHMHWYREEEKVSVCECRCSRARLPPSKFWLFEPRCGMHDIGGWYIETFGKYKKNHTVPSQRYWDGFDASEQYEKRLHPAMYLLALAYRTLDLEDAKRRKWTIRHSVEGKLLRILSWCKKLI